VTYVALVVEAACEILVKSSSNQKGAKDLGRSGQSCEQEVNMSGLGLLGAYHGSSSDDSSDDEDVRAAPAVADETPKPKLANPFEMGGLSHKPSYMVEAQEYHDKKTPGAVSDSSVFSNPFKAKEDRKRALLERHVEMTSKQEDSKTLRGKKICWNFRKGRCRFGSKCTFAHDNDVALPKTDEEESEKKLPPPVVQLGVPDPDPSSVEDNSSAVISHNKRKRPGLSDGLTPSKKASKFYNKVYSNN